MSKQKKILLFSLISILIIILITSISAKMCNTDETKSILKKALFDYLPNPESSNLDKNEIKDLLDFYLNSSNLTEIKCDIKSTLSDANYDVIVSRFFNFTKDITIPYCDDGTHYGKCSTTKPKYCFAGKLVNRCRKCGCPSGQECQIDEKAEFTIHEGRWGKCMAVLPTPMPSGENVTILDDFDGDGINETVTNTGIISWGPGNISNNIIVFPDYSYHTLKYYDIDTGTLTNTEIDITSIFGYPISKNIIAFSTREVRVGEDLNQDGDTSDEILKYYDINTDTLTNTGIDAQWQDISNNIITFTIREARVGEDLNNDGDTSDRILKYYDINTDTLTNTGIDVGYSPPSISNNIIAFSNTLKYYDIDTDTLTNTGIDIRDYPSISNNIIAFKTGYNPILKYYDIDTDTLTNTGIDVDHEVLGISNNIITFTIREARVGEDLNNDGDTSDRILKYYDINTDTLTNTGIVVKQASSISNNIITFSTEERDIGEDLNQDGDMNDDILRYLTLSKYRAVEEPQNIFCTFSGCSERKPHYCDNGVMVDKCEVCGCPNATVCLLDGSCVTPTCSNLGGDICAKGEYCPGNKLNSSGTDMCCSKECATPTWNLCNECGKGLFNICDRTECNSISENCYFKDNLILDSCSACSNTTCENYGRDNTTCSEDHCNLGNCFWEGSCCVTVINRNWTDNLNEGLFAYYNFSSELDLVSGGENNLIIKRENPQFVQNLDSFQAGDGISGFCPSSANLDGWNVNNQIDFGFDNINTPEISFAGWAKITGPGSGNGGKPLFSKGWNHNGWTLVYHFDHRKFFLGGLSGQNLGSSTLINPNQWYHIVVTRDSSQTCLWINGVQEDCRSSKIAETNNFKIDVCGSFDGTVGFQGYLDEWGFWKRELSDDEIASLYNYGKGIFPDSFSPSINITCSDGTNYNNCSSTKPLYCDDGILINNCSLCGCPTNQTCQADGTCAIVKTISNFSDGSTETNLTFNETGNQTIYVEIPPEANVTNATLDITSNVTNASLDVGHDGDIDATFNETNVTLTTPDLAPPINEYIINGNNLSQNQIITGEVIFTDSGNILIPLTFYSESTGTIKMSNININYIINPSSIEEPSFFERVWNFIKKFFK